MKKILIAVLLLACSAFSFAADASFLIGKNKFYFTAREGAVTYDLVVLMDDKVSGEVGWGGADGSVIYEDFNDDAIMAKGGRRQFIVWGLAEAKRRAALHVNALKPPPPDPNNKMASTVWNLLNNLDETPDGSDVIIPPAPLP